MPREDLGRRLRALREEKGLKLAQASTRLRISIGYLSLLETGKTGSPPSEALLQACARLYDEDADLLLHLAGRLPADVEALLLSDVPMWGVLREAQRRGLTAEDLRALVARAA